MKPHSNKDEPSSSQSSPSTIMISLYYCYVTIPENSLEELKSWQIKLCHDELNLKGRIRLSHEGLNGVLSGYKKDLVTFEERLRDRLNLEGYCESKVNGNEERNDIDELEDTKCDDGCFERTRPRSYGEMLDFKYCHLRKGKLGGIHDEMDVNGKSNTITAESQMFRTLSVKITKEVVSLDNPSDSIDVKPAGTKGRGRNAGSRRRRERRRLMEENKRESENLCDQSLLEQRLKNSCDADEGSKDEVWINDENKTKKNYAANDNILYAKNHTVTKEEDSDINQHPAVLDLHLNLNAYKPGQHLSPKEWNDRLLLSSSKDNDTRSGRHDNGDNDHKGCENANNNDKSKTQFSSSQRAGNDIETKINIDRNDGNDNGNIIDDHKDSVVYDSIDGDNCSNSSESTSIIIDARNVYESRIGQFRVPGVPTLLANTRKYSSLPTILQGSMQHLAGKDVFMYCTGGVRCERASSYLSALAESDAWPKGHAPPRNIYQLQGGIQKYLESYGVMEEGGQRGDCEEIKNKSDDLILPESHSQLHPELDSTLTVPHPVIKNELECNAYDFRTGGSNNISSSSSNKLDDHCLYHGKNYVFDPRRYDPMVGNVRISSSSNENGSLAGSNHKNGSVVIGRCLLCRIPHDDYDNGSAPCDNKESRCCRCRALVLVCNSCRVKVYVWGETDKGIVAEDDTYYTNDNENLKSIPDIMGDEKENSKNNDTVKIRKISHLFCGPGGKICINEGNNGINHSQIVHTSAS